MDKRFTGEDIIATRIFLAEYMFGVEGANEFIMRALESFDINNVFTRKNYRTELWVLTSLALDRLGVMDEQALNNLDIDNYFYKQIVIPFNESGHASYDEASSVIAQLIEFCAYIRQFSRMPLPMIERQVFNLIDLAKD